jgi:hypothetical protein
VTAPPRAGRVRSCAEPTLQYRVTQKNGAEPPFRNEYWDNKEPGICVDVVSGEPLGHLFQDGPGKREACATASTPPPSASSRSATWNAKATAPTASSSNRQTTLAVPYNDPVGTRSSEAMGFWVHSHSDTKLVKSPKTDTARTRTLGGRPSQLPAASPGRES